jgi:hypothetical protein
MATFSMVSLDEARRLVLPPRRAVQERYREYVRNLGSEAAGRLELEDNDKSITERARLKAAARSEGLNLHIQRQGRTIAFWVTDEPPKSPAKPPVKTSGGSGGRGRKKAS